MSQVKITSFFTPAKKRPADEDEVICLSSSKRPCQKIDSQINSAAKRSDEDDDEPVLHIRTPRRKRILESDSDSESEPTKSEPKLMNDSPSIKNNNSIKSESIQTQQACLASPKATKDNKLHSTSPCTPLQDRINKYKTNESGTPYTPQQTYFTSAAKYKDGNTPTSTPKFRSHPNKLHFDSPASKNTTTNGSAVDERVEDDFPHTKYDFLKDENIRDIEHRKKNHPDYDPKTLFVPQSFLLKQTPALRQWWLIKQKNMDAILFFKMGKFYEFFNQDAVVAVNELDIIYMKSEEDKPAHAGFPEISYQKYSNLLIKKGYKVIRIEQTETPEMAEERCQKTGLKSKFDRVVNREICRVTTKGTQMLGVMQSIFHTANNQYLLALAECTKNSSSERDVSIGVCFIDVTIGKMHFGQFEDDRTRSNLHLLLAHRTPVEILVERNKLTDITEKVITRSQAQIVHLRSGSEFWDQKTTMKYLHDQGIYCDDSEQVEYPKFLSDMFDVDESGSLERANPKTEFCMAIKSFCACVYYLHSHMIAKQVLGSSLFEIYIPPLNRFVSEEKKLATNGGLDSMPTLMILDHVALRNLEVFENSAGGSTATLLEAVDRCHTHFGKRLLREWMSSPICDIGQINARLDAVEALMSQDNASLLNLIADLLRQTPDLERLLSKIKSESVSSGNEARAVMFDNDIYSKAKIKSFLELLSNFRKINNFVIDVSSNLPRNTSSVLRKLLTFKHLGGSVPDCSETLNFFDHAFDHRKAKESGKIMPERGVDQDYDKAIEQIRAVQDQLDDYLRAQRKLLKCDKLEYFGSGKNRFQLQIPERYCQNLSNDYELETSRKGFKRYYTTAIKRLSEQMTKAEASRDQALTCIMKNLFGKFCRKHKDWSDTTQCLAVLDVLVSFAQFTRSMQASNVDICRPMFLDISASKKAFIKYTDGRHPALIKRDCSFTANDMELDEKLILLTGANMGGKSTLMRQTGLLVILAQMGCFVTASSLELTPVDRIFSRLGASDQLLEGESTFYTELIETSDMLAHATAQSLVLLDELGRGTATYDGTAIAFAVLSEISNNIRCRCLFSTHYHSLVEEFEKSTTVKMAHMACKVEDEGDENESNKLNEMSLETITFLYKLASGSCPKSYGFNVARLAGLDSDLVKCAFKKAKQAEFEFNIFKRIQKLTVSDQLDEEKICNEVLESLS